ncbi:MAG: YraN family protein [Glaciihabitans sp.]|nr:YraN family protein [Glaciihabitans sp.]
MAAKDELGRRGEQWAVTYLEKHGLRIIERNWRCSYGEIDVIADDDGEFVFVEVKTRSSVAFGHPLQAVTAAKLARMRRLAAAWCAENPGSHHRVRLDVVAIVVGGPATITIDHLVRVF